MDSIDDPCDLWRGQLHTELQQLGILQTCLDKTTAKLDELNKQKQSIKLLETIPGAGPRTTEAVVAIIDGPNRFKSCSHQPNDTIGQPFRGRCLGFSKWPGPGGVYRLPASSRKGLVFPGPYLILLVAHNAVNANQKLKETYQQQSIR